MHNHLQTENHAPTFPQPWSKFGCLEKFINIVHQFHDGMFAWVLGSGQHSHAFPVTNGVKQSCVLAPMLFNMMFSAMLSNAFNEDEHGIKVNYQSVSSSI